MGAQAALMRLTRDAPAVAAAGELLEALKAENAQLQVRCCGAETFSDGCGCAALLVSELCTGVIGRCMGTDGIDT